MQTRMPTIRPRFILPPRGRYRDPMARWENLSSLAIQVSLQGPSPCNHNGTRRRLHDDRDLTAAALEDRERRQVKHLVEERAHLAAAAGAGDGRFHTLKVGAAGL